MSAEVIPPKRTNYVAILLMTLGTVLIIWGLYKLYLLYGPTLETKSINVPVLEKDTFYSNTNTITLNGEAEPNSQIFIKEAGQTIKQVDTDETGFFAVTLDLKEGTHRLTLYTYKIKILKLKSKPTDIIVNVDKIRPALKKLKYPTKVTGSKLNLAGDLTEPAKLVIQAGDSRIWEKNMPAGHFNIAVPLKNLESPQLYVYAIDKAGNVSKSQKISVVLNRAVLSERARRAPNISAKKLPNSAGVIDIAVASLAKNLSMLYFLALTAIGYGASLFIVKAIKS